MSGEGVLSASYLLSGKSTKQVVAQRSIPSMEEPEDGNAEKAPFSTRISVLRIPGYDGKACRPAEITLIHGRD